MENKQTDLYIWKIIDSFRISAPPKLEFKGFLTATVLQDAQNPKGGRELPMMSVG